MECSESEAVFDAHELNPQRFINEVFNSVEDLIDGAFDFCLQKASVITADAGGDRSQEDLAKGVATVRAKVQAVVDKRMGIWEKYCLRHCFAVPEGFVLPKANEPSAEAALIQEGFWEPELDSQLESLRKKLVAAGKTSAELHREISALEKQSTLSSNFDNSVAEALQPYEQNSVDDMFKELGKATSMLHLKLEAIRKREYTDHTHGRSKKQHLTPDEGLPSRLEDIQEILGILETM